MAINNWAPAFKAAKILDMPRNELNGLCNNKAFKLGKHYTSGPLTRSRDTYYWNIPAVEAMLSELSSNAEAVA
jgi:hypothetical protein